MPHSEKYASNQIMLPPDCPRLPLDQPLCKPLLISEDARLLLPTTWHSLLYSQAQVRVRELERESQPHLRESQPDLFHFYSATKYVHLLMMLHDRAGRQSNNDVDTQGRPPIKQG